MIPDSELFINLNCGVSTPDAFRFFQRVLLLFARKWRVQYKDYGRQGLQDLAIGSARWPAVVCLVQYGYLGHFRREIVYFKSYDITRDNDTLGVMRTRIQSAQHNININQIVSSPSVNSTGHSKAQLIGNSRTTIRAPMMVAGRDERTYGAGSSSPGPSSQNIAERADIQSSPRMIPVSLGVKCRSRYESEWTGSIADIAAEAIE
jgi:hypothetical protein